MPLTPAEAADALRDVERTQRRSFSAYSYKSGAPFLLLWGLVWLIGYGTVELAPKQSGLVWFVLAVAGSVASAVIGMRMKPAGKPRFDGRIFITWLASLGFLSALFSIIGTITSQQVGAIIPLFIGWAYVVMGAWMGWRFIAAGLAVAALTIGGYFYFPEHFAGWMAIVGGSTLIGTGLWLRSV